MMTFLTRCLLCGGPVMEWGKDDAKCVGYCGLKQTKIEDLTPAQWKRNARRVQRQIELDAATTVEVKGDRL